MKKRIWLVVLAVVLAAGALIGWKMLGNQPKQPEPVQETETVQEMTEAEKERYYQAAVSLKNAGETALAKAMTNRIPGYKDADTLVENAADTLLFGRYEQDGDKTNGAEQIEWLVLDQDGDNVLLLSKYALDCKRFNDVWAPVEWKDCTLRAWLNGEFMEKAFDETERGRIALSEITLEANPRYDTPAGTDTQDKIFLLSIRQAEKYFPEEEDRKCEPTAYALANNAYIDKGACWWWLRSAGGFEQGASGVFVDGFIRVFGSRVNDDDLTVRPAIQIDLKTLLP